MKLRRCTINLAFLFCMWEETKVPEKTHTDTRRTRKLQLQLQLKAFIHIFL